MVDSLTDDATGCYLVVTQSGSQYWLDLGRRILRRMAGPVFHAERRLRRDGEDIVLLEVMRCELGQPMILLINLAAPGVYSTIRISTPVVSIETTP